MAAFVYDDGVIADADVTSRIEALQVIIPRTSALGGPRLPRPTLARPDMARGAATLASRRAALGDRRWHLVRSLHTND